MLPPGPHRRAASVTIGLALLLFGLLAWQLLVRGPMTQRDAEVTLWLAAHRQPWLTAAMHFVSDLHRPWVALVLAALLALGFAWRRHPRWAWTLLVVPTALLLNTVVKDIFQRARPVLPQPLVHYDTYSFPSGHVAMATALWGAIALSVFAHSRSARVRRAIAVLAPAMVALVAFSRVYLGAHYLSDVLASACLAVAWVVAFATFIHRERA